MKNLNQIKTNLRIAASCILFLGGIIAGVAQQTINGTLAHDGLMRTYILYVPANYTGTEEVPLLFNFHGYGSDATEQMFYGDFRPIADTEGFIIVHPMGLLDNSQEPQTHFNVGWGNSTIDDVGYTEALIDDLSLNYSIDAKRIYSTGMSNGGFMSYTLACELSDRIAAIASVTGTMNVNQSSTCTPLHQMPIMEIHGTNDVTVPYGGSAIGFEGTENVVNFWVGFNNCDTNPTIINIADTNTSDRSTVEHIVYSNGDNGAAVELYKVIDGGHTWPGSAFALPNLVTNYDINASEKIWEFFSKYTIDGEIATLSIGELTENNTITSIYPNPANSVITVALKVKEPLEYAMYALDGKRVLQGTISAIDNTIDVTGLSSSGIYYLNIQNTFVKILKN